MELRLGSFLKFLILRGSIFLFIIPILSKTWYITAIIPKPAITEITINAFFDYSDNRGSLIQPILYLNS